MIGTSPNLQCCCTFYRVYIFVRMVSSSLQNQLKLVYGAFWAEQHAQCTDCISAPDKSGRRQVYPSVPVPKELFKLCRGDLCKYEYIGRAKRGEPWQAMAPPSHPWNKQPNKYILRKEKLRSYCPNIYTVRAGQIKLVSSLLLSSEIRVPAASTVPNVCNE